MMKIALASPPFPKSLSEGLSWLAQLVEEAAAAQAAVVCFPESFLPGYPGMGYTEEDRSLPALQAALEQACQLAARHAMAIILPMDMPSATGWLNVAHVISERGTHLGYQTKNQLDPTEDLLWVPGMSRQIFEIQGVKIAITICHEGFRYPESVRWAAQQGAQLIFHPHFTGSNTEGAELKAWGHRDNPYYEKAMLMRALENTVYFASVNYASRYPDSGSAVIAPDGQCIAHAPYQQVGITTAEINPALATGLLAKRFKNHLYH